MSKTQKKPAERDQPEKVGERSLTGGAALLAGWNQSLAEFYLRRFQKYWQYPLQLAEMRSLEDVAQSLVAFEAQLLADYADQAEALQRLARSESGRATGRTGHYESRLLKAQHDAALIIEQAKAQAERIIASARSRADGATDRDAEEPIAAARRTAHG
ncbi:MAG: hypothetical protein WD036_10750 [Bauldia sp.]